MASAELRIINRRIKSVRSTKKITRAGDELKEAVTAFVATLETTTEE